MQNKLIDGFHSQDQRPWNKSNYLWPPFVFDLVHQWEDLKQRWPETAAFVKKRKGLLQLILAGWEKTASVHCYLATMTSRENDLQATFEFTSAFISKRG